NGFQLEHPEFLLFPTLFHQQRESVLPTAQARFDLISQSFPAPDRIHIDFFAQVIDWRKLESLPDAERLRGQHIWRDDVIADRFDWGKNKSIFALAVRIFRFPKTIILPHSPGYGGCKSWIMLEQEIDVASATPVLGDAAFAVKLSRFRKALF